MEFNGISWNLMTWSEYLSGWWYTYPSEKYDFVSWDDETPKSQDVENIKFIFQTTNQKMTMWFNGM